MAPIVSLAPGHENVTLALVTLFLVFMFYSLLYPFLTFLIPILFLGLCGHLFFFRDPDRKINSDPQSILAPADGKVYEINASEGVIRIRLSLFDVHITRNPVSGNITDINRQEGKHWPFVSFIRRGTKENARQTIQIANSIGEFFVVQIVGTIARRCRSYVSLGDQIQQGERLGMIYYGSEVDIHFPPEKFEIMVKEKSKVIAGQTPIARLKHLI
ncbi:MAG: phosphatidylserine decarboxylase [Candidatus Heimdallarchaeota archaeon]|nr:MAG: phosphatidylserine decarboxylase [Candidatus Heimdallarchaeota archaeon]